MDNHSNIAAWMISGGLRSSDPEDERNLEHLRALKASRSSSPSIVSRIATAIAAIRPAASHADPEFGPA